MDTEPDQVPTPAPAPTPSDTSLDAAINSLPKDPNQMLKDIQGTEEKK